MRLLRIDVDEVRSALASAGFEPLVFSLDDATEVRKLPPIHRDPFDRALVAQARCQGLRLLTATIVRRDILRGAVMRSVRSGV